MYVNIYGNIKRKSISISNYIHLLIYTIVESYCKAINYWCSSSFGKTICWAIYKTFKPFICQISSMMGLNESNTGDNAGINPSYWKQTPNHLFYVHQENFITEYNLIRHIIKLFNQSHHRFRNTSLSCRNNMKKKLQR